MKHLTIKNDKCIIKLNNNFYSESIIQEGIKDFSKNQKIKLMKNGDIIIEKNSDENIEDIGLHFCDYLLSLIQGGNFSWH